MKYLLCLAFPFLMGNLNAQNYCNSSGTLTTFEWIESVKIVNYVNISGNDNGYASFINEPVNISQLGNPTVTLSPGIAQANDTPYEYWRVWVDLNGDYDFTDGNELVFDSGDVSEDPVTFTFFVPANSHIGPTRMRVAMKFVSPDSPDLPQDCGGFAYGEVEDYTINILETIVTPPQPTTNTNSIEANAWQVFPNPTTNFLNWNDVNGVIETITCYDIKGKLVLKQSDITENTIDVSGLAAGNYFIKAVINGELVNRKFTIIK